MKRETYILLTVGISLLVAASAGCQPELKHKFSRRAVSIETEPSGARVSQVEFATRERLFLGTTPILNQTVLVLTNTTGSSHDPVAVNFAAAEQDMVRVIIEKDGYKPYESRLYTKEDEVVVHKITLEKDVPP